MCRSEAPTKNSRPQTNYEHVYSVISIYYALILVLDNHLPIMIRMWKKMRNTLKSLGKKVPWLVPEEIFVRLTDLFCFV